jgi:hypothetical protein
MQRTIYSCVRGHTSHQAQGGGRYTRAGLEDLSPKRQEPRLPRAFETLMHSVGFLPAHNWGYYHRKFVCSHLNNNNDLHR